MNQHQRSPFAMGLSLVGDYELSSVLIFFPTPATEAGMVLLAGTKSLESAYFAVLLLVEALRGLPHLRSCKFPKTL